MTTFPSIPRRRRPLLLLLTGLFLTWIPAGFHLQAAAPGAPAANESPTDWIDPDTGHRVVRLSREPGTASLYFHQNAYTPDGTKLIVTTPDRDIAAIDLATREIRTVVAGPVAVLVTGRKSGDVYYTRWEAAGETRADGTKAAAESSGGSVPATNVDTLKTRKVVVPPPGRFVARRSTPTRRCCWAPRPGRRTAAVRTRRASRAAVPSRGMPTVDPRFQQADSRPPAPTASP